MKITLTYPPYFCNFLLIFLCKRLYFYIKLLYNNSINIFIFMIIPILMVIYEFMIVPILMVILIFVINNGQLIIII